MNKNIYFDHTYTIDQNHAFLKSLANMGFKVFDYQVKHPDSECRFLYFEKGSYLEFIHCPNDMKMKKCPGFSFGSRKELKSLYEKYKKNGLSCDFSHRNYRWYENSKDHLPGWNFLNFKNLGFKTFYPWFTEYEPNPNIKKTKSQAIKHPNGVDGIVGHEFIVNKDGRNFFQATLGTLIKDKVKLSCGTTFYFQEGRSNYHSKIILNSKNIKKSLSYMRNEEITSFKGRDCILIKNPSSNKRMWDILIAEGY